MKWEYLLVLSAVAVVPLVLSLDRNLRLYRHWRALIKTGAIVCLVFWAWDVVVTSRGHWRFNDMYVLGHWILGMPLEEWLFFPVIVFVSIFTWESAKFFAGRKR